MDYKKVIKTIPNKKILIEQKDLNLSSSWDFYCHSIKSNDWSIKGYKKLYTITKISDFWKIINNIKHFGVNIMHFYLMRKGIQPTWEDPNNRHCGICSLKIDFKDTCDAFEMFSTYLVTNQLLTNMNSDCINGISISPKINFKNSYTIIKIWNKKTEVNIGKILNKNILDKYGKNGLQYKLTNPEN